MNTTRLILPLLASLAGVATAHAENLDQTEALTRISQVLTCKRVVSPEQFDALVTAAKGQATVQASELSDAEYSLAQPVEVYGQPITQLTVHAASDGEGDFNEFSGMFKGQRVEDIAKLSGIGKDDLGHYTQEVGNHDVSLRGESGSTYVACTQDKRPAQ